MMYISIFFIAATLLIAPLLIVLGNNTRVLPFRLLIAIGLTYLSMNFALHSYRTASWEQYRACQSQFSDGLVQQHAECGERNIADGASIVFYALFGWIPAAGYVGCWELARRIIFRNHIKQSDHSRAARWFSNAVIIFIIPLLVYAAPFAAIIVYSLFP